MTIGRRIVIGSIRRSFSSTATRRWDVVPEWASHEARTALEGLQTRFNNGDSSSSSSSRGAFSTYTHVLDANQIHLLRTTQARMLALGSGSGDVNDEEALQKREDDLFTGRTGKQTGVMQNGVAQGSIIVPTEHLAFFTPRVSSLSLGADGSDTSFNPPGGVFTRRMWAGGQMSWRGHEAADQLRVGDSVWERTFVEDAQIKKLAGGRGEMIVVWVRKEFGVEGSSTPPMIVDRRSWLFQKALDPRGKKSDRSTSPPPISSSDSQDYSPPRDLVNPTRIVQSAANLFRYSALTFNAHAIHLSTAWARDVEGHRDIVVHGPLNLSLLVRKWGRDLDGWRFNDRGEFVTDGKRALINVSYRAKRPVYAGQTYWIGLLHETDKSAHDSHRVVAMHSDGQVAMEATIESKGIKAT